jgi:hypothetical protein
MRVNPSTQSGVTLTGLILTLIVVALVAILGMRVVPDLIEYGKILSNVKAVAKDPGLKDASLAQVRTAFDRRANIDQIDTLKGADIEVSKENGQLVLSFAYTKRIPMVGPVSLLIDFEGSTAK